MDNNLIFLTIAVIVGLWLYKRFTKEDKHSFESQGIPYEKPLPIVGNFLPIFRKQESVFDLFERIYSKFPNDK